MAQPLPDNADDDVIDDEGSELPSPELLHQRAEQAVDQALSRQEGALKIAPSAYRQVPLCEVDGDPYNVRTQLTGIEELARSIEQHGLLENLVVVEIEPRIDYWATLGRDEEDNVIQREVRYELRAGSRRFAALEWLIVRGKLSATYPVPVVVINTNGIFENLVENIQRQDVTPWDIGRRLNELQSAGMSTRDIGSRLGHTPGWVSRYQKIAAGLAPETIKYLTERKVKWILGDLYRWAHLTDSMGEPDADEQIRQIQLKRHRARSTKRPEAWRAMTNRLHYLEKQMPVPALIQPIVRSLCAYIIQGGKLNLRQLEADLLTSTKRIQAARAAGDKP